MSFLKGQFKLGRASSKWNRASSKWNRAGSKNKSGPVHFLTNFGHCKRPHFLDPMGPAPLSKTCNGHWSHWSLVYLDLLLVVGVMSLLLQGSVLRHLALLGKGLLEATISSYSLSNGIQHSWLLYIRELLIYATSQVCDCQIMYRLQLSSIAKLSS